MEIRTENGRVRRARALRPALIGLGVMLSVAVGSMQRAAAPPPAVAAPQGSVTPRVVAAANAFLATLSEAERAKGTFAFNSSQRTVWSNLPSGIFQRNGLANMRRVQTIDGI